ncbi:MAG: tetratricopeptide repeat protein [Gammaproteobacteria bacterium]
MLLAKSGLKNFWSELRRRKVVRVAVVYVLVAWLLIQIAEAIFEPLQLPPWSLTFVIVIAALGFPLALILAWALELSPDGLQREKTQAEANAEADIARASENTLAAAAPAGKVRSDKRRAIAVLPLSNMSGDPENEFFSDGITEEILNLLARIPDLRVVSRTSSFSFKHTTLDVPAIAEKLGVDIVLEGSVRRSGNRVRIVAQLIDAANDAHLWSAGYDRELEDIFAVQTEIARSIVDAMNLDPATCVDCGGNTENIDAYDYYLRGRQYFHHHTGATMQFAREMFDKAIEADPGYARAYAGLADTESLIAQWVDGSPERLEAADRASRKALELGPQLAEAHASRGFALSINGDYEEAAKQFERALELDPQHYESLYLYGRARYAQGKLEHAVDLWARAHEAQPDEFQSLALSAGLLKKLGRENEDRDASIRALEQVERRLRLNPDDLRALSLGPGLLIDLGRTDEALAMVERAVALAPNDSSVLHNAVCSYAHAGEVDKAIEMLERRMQAAGTIYRDWVKHDPDFDNIRDDPRFHALVDQPPAS